LSGITELNKNKHIPMLVKQAEVLLPTLYGDFTLLAFSADPEDPMPLLVLKKEVTPGELPLVRLHSECLTGDTFASRRCDCGEQLHIALEMIGTSGGYLLYLRQEGRGIGLINKLKAYKLQEEGLNTLEANIHLGFRGDEREYSEAVEVLLQLGVTELDLITNNPAKVDYLASHGITVRNRISLIITPGEQNKAYLDVKKDLMGHLL